MAVNPGLRPRRPRTTTARAAFALLVAGALALGSATAVSGVVASSAADHEVAAAPVEVDLPRPVSGRAAVRALAGDLPVAAALNDQSPAELRTLLLEDPTMWLDQQGRLFVRDVLGPEHAYVGDRAAESTKPTEPSSAPVAPLADTFELASLPDSERTIFLDFDGHRLADTLWNDQDGVAPATHAGWDPDRNGAGFTDRERGLVQEIWSRIAEDYAPYDVNVTTADPGEAALTRSSAGDHRFGMRVLFSDSTALFDAVTSGSTVGLAYIGTFDQVDRRDVAPALVFTSRMTADPALLADVASHEVGHTLGLPHVHGKSGVRPVTALYGPLMMPMVTGSAITQWALPDVTEIPRGGLTLRGDEAGGTPGAATSVTESSTSGVISSASDEDWYRLNGCAALTLAAFPATHGPNLDLTLRLVDASDTTLASDAPTTTLSGGLVRGQGARLSRTLDGSTHYAVVAGGGDGVGGTTGAYDRTGSIGGYTLDVVGCDTAASAPSIPRSVRAITTDDGTTTVTWQPPAHSGGTAITAYEVSVDAAPVVTLRPDQLTHSIRTGPGRRTVTVRARNTEGASGVVEVTSAIPPSAPRSASMLSAPPAYSQDPDERLLRFSGADEGGLPLTGITLRIDSTTGPLVLDRDDPDVSWIITVPPTSNGRLAWIRLHNEAGAGAWKSFVIRPQVVAPRAPTALGVAHDRASNVLTVTWKAPADDGGAPVDHRVRVGNGAWITVPGTTTRHQFAGTRPTGQAVEVRAVNTAGLGAVARTYAFAPGTTVPGRGKVTSAQRGKAGGPKSVVVAWRPPTATGGAALTGHRLVVQRLNARGKAVSTTRTQAFGPGVRRHEVKLARTGRYRFAVQSRNAKGWGATSPWSKKVTPR